MTDIDIDAITARAEAVTTPAHIAAIKARAVWARAHTTGERTYYNSLNLNDVEILFAYFEAELARKNAEIARLREALNEVQTYRYFIDGIQAAIDAARDGERGKTIEEIRAALAGPSADGGDA
jgi:hypothetical protein